MCGRLKGSTNWSAGNGHFNRRIIYANSKYENVSCKVKFRIAKSISEEERVMYEQLIKAKYKIYNRRTSRKRIFLKNILFDERYPVNLK